MDRKITTCIVAIGLLVNTTANAQPDKECLTYLDKLPAGLELTETMPQKYTVTTEYLNRDIYGNAQGKVKVTGEYARGLGQGFVSWNNVNIAHSENQPDKYTVEILQKYMENLKYIPSAQMLEETIFADFPDHPDNIYSRNLIWDMMAIEEFAWNYFDSLRLNEEYTIPDITGNFSMADVGTYSHKNIQLCWCGVSKINGTLCAIVEYRALNNKLRINTSEMKSKGSELYWGKVLVSLESKSVEYAEMYSNTVQEIEMQGLPNKFLATTVRILRVERLQ